MKDYVIRFTAGGKNTIIELSIEQQPDMNGALLYAQKLVPLMDSVRLLKEIKPKQPKKENVTGTPEAKEAKK